MAIAGENDRFTLIRCKDNDEWLHQRTLGVGGSDVAAIMGISPWKTPAQVWLEKTGRAMPEDLSDKPYVEFGNIMEPLIGRWYADRHPDRIVRRVNAICKSKERPWAQASLDYEVCDGGRWGVLEIKTARTAQDWQDGVPLYYQTQIIHYMTVTGRRFADVAVFFRDTCEFREFRVEYDEEDAAAIAGDVDNFWHDFVKADIMPRLVGTAGELAGLTDWHSPSNGEVVPNHDPEALDAITAYQDAADREKKAKADKTVASARLAEIIGDAKGIETDVARVTWSRYPAEKFDTKRFREDHPSLYAQYATTYTKSGGIRIKENR